LTIPIVIGVTGHRDLRENDIPQLRNLVRTELRRLKIEYPHSPLLMLNSLAAGADLLCAEVATELGIILKCPLPMSIEQYRKDFDATTVTHFETALSHAKEVFIAPNTEPLPDEASRDYHYLQAGRYVARHSHLLLALWDGSPAKPYGCGTAEIVAFMLGTSDESDTGFFKAANDGAVLHIETLRHSAQEESYSPSVRLLENEPSSLLSTLEAIDTFNADAEKLTGAVKQKEPLVIEAVLSGMPEDMRQLHAAYQASDRLSLWFQASYLRAIRYFSIFGALLVLFFLLYDEMESNLFLICYGLLILIYVLAFVRIRKGQVHEKYLRYRMLSETLRAQFFLRAAGSSDNVANAFTWTQKQESTWIKQVVSALLTGESGRQSLPDETIQKIWIEGQLAYHEGAYRRASCRHHIRESTAKWMLAATFALFILVLALEFAFDSAMTKALFQKPFPPLMLYHSGQTVTLRNLMKILLGTVSAMAVFLANYYGKLSLDRRSIDHNRMARLYASAKEQYESGQINHMLIFVTLAREEIIEIGNWYSYSRENPPSLQV